jgi:hypothetical protein
MTWISFPTSDTAPLRERLAEVKTKFEWFVYDTTTSLERLERAGSDHGDYWRERALAEIGRELERWEGK